MGDVHTLQLVDVGANFVFDPDGVLEEAKGQGFVNVVVIGECECGAIYVTGAKNAGEALFLLERAKMQIVGGPPNG